MGKKAKDHRKKVASRNARIQSQRNGLNNAMKLKIEEIRQKYAQSQSGTTEEQQQ